MTTLSEDEAAPFERLERWASEQQQLIQQRRLAERHRLTRLRRIKLTLLKMKADLESGSHPVVDRVLDRGLHTSGNATEPEHEHPDRQVYAPSPWNVLPRALRHLGVSDEDTFVDFGCGKGRIVHQA